MNKFFNILMLSFALSLLFSCAKQQDMPKRTFDLVSTKVDLTSNGGTATLTANGPVAKVELSSDWAHYTINGKKVSLTFDPNPTYESRTITVKVFCKMNNVQEVSFTQLGIINIINLPDEYQFDYVGGSFEAEWKTKDKFTIEGIDESWLSYTVQDEKIIFTAKARPADAKDVRSVNLVVRVGSLFQQTMRISQGTLIDYIPGNYDLSYTETAISPGRRRLDAQIIKNANNTYVLSILDGDNVYNLSVSFDISDLSLGIKPQSITYGDNLEAALICLPEDYTRQGLKTEGDYGVVARYNEGVFTFEDNGLMNDWVPVKGFALLDSSYKPILPLLYNIVLTRK